jgi:DNA-binding beta-propeller fold protein YncE
VTAETENRLITVDLDSGTVTKRMSLPADPEFVSAGARRAVAVSPDSGTVTLLDATSGRPIRELRGFGSPHIAEITRDGRYAYVTDDARGQLCVIRLRDGRLLARIPVGVGAHHLAIRPDGREAWIALGESAHTIVVVDTSNPRHPYVAGRFDPGYPAHDLAFTPGGKRVWITSSSTGEIGIFAAQSRQLVDRVEGGAPPQHVVFSGDSAYVASGYGDRLELVRIRTGKVLKAVHAPHGSFNLAVSHGFVAVASLLRGTLAIYNERLEPEHVLHIAPAARDVAIASR